MKPARRTLHLGAFLQSSGYHPAAWRHPDAQADGGLNLAHYRSLAETAERGRFDLIFVADFPGAPSRENAGARVSAHFEPVTLWSALSALTRHIGFVASASTTYDDPYLTARRFASLDWISGGRAGWNVVTTFANVARNFSRDEHLEHDLRYARAEEFVDVVKGLWDSHEDDAFVRDKASGTYVDLEKVHLLNHVGPHFQVSGPLNVARPPQGHPVVFQAGSSSPGRELAARTADGVFTAALVIEEAQAFYRDLKARMARSSRQPDELVIMPGLFPVLGGTELEAKAHYEELQALAPPSAAWTTLRNLYGGIDLSGYSLDDPAPPPPTVTSGPQGKLRVTADLIARTQPTLRELYNQIAQHTHRVVVGTPEQVADTIQLWFESGAADGFNILPPVLPRSLAEFVAEVVPILQRRGLYRREYEGTTLREHLGLRRPPNTLAQRASAAHGGGALRSG
ncbi:MAG: LLM class flavin-dependent oxidoreductase [Polyangiaceae bacterium]